MLVLPDIGIKGESRQVCLQERREKLSRAPIDTTSSLPLNALRAQSVLLQLHGLSRESCQPVHKICFPPPQTCWLNFFPLANMEEICFSSKICGGSCGSLWVDGAGGGRFGKSLSRNGSSSALRAWNQHS